LVPKFICKESVIETFLGLNHYGSDIVRYDATAKYKHQGTVFSS